MRLLLSIACATTLLTAGVACGSRSNAETVYVESVPGSGLPQDRAYAVRLTLFEFAESAGGIVEYFAIDGAVNTARAPYFATDACAYFGPGPIDRGEFRVDADGPNGDRIIMQVTRDGRRALEARVVRDAGLQDVPGEPGEPLALELVESDGEVIRRCP